MWTVFLCLFLLGTISTVWKVLMLWVMWSTHCLFVCLFVCLFIWTALLSLFLLGTISTVWKLLMLWVTWSSHCITKNKLKRSRPTHSCHSAQFMSWSSVTPTSCRSCWGMNTLMWKVKEYTSVTHNVVCNTNFSFAWPGSETAVDLVLLQTLMLLKCKSEHYHVNPFTGKGKFD